VLPSAHSSPQPKRQIDQFGRLCTAHGRKSLYFTTGRPFPQKLPLSMGDLEPHLIHDFLGPSKPIIQTAPQSVQPFLHRWPQSIPILYNRTSLSPSKLPLPTGRSGPPSNTWFPVPTQVLNSNGISIGSAIFAGLTSVTDRQTDRPTDYATRLVTTDRIYVHSTGDAV